MPHTLEAHLEPNRTSTMKLFCRNSQWRNVVNYFRKKAPPYMFDCDSIVYVRLHTPRSFIQARNYEDAGIICWTSSTKYHFLMSSRHSGIFIINFEHTRNSPLEEFCKKFGLKNFEEFTAIQCARASLFIKLQAS